MDAGQLFAQLRTELYGVAHDLYLYSLENKKTIEAEKKIDDKNHPTKKKSYLKIWSLDEKIMSIGELLGINEASCPLGELDNKKPL